MNVSGNFSTIVDIPVLNATVALTDIITMEVLRSSFHIWSTPPRDYPTSGSSVVRIGRWGPSVLSGATVHFVDVDVLISADPELLDATSAYAINFVAVLPMANTSSVVCRVERHRLLAVTTS